MQFTIFDLTHELQGSVRSHLIFLVRHWMHDNAGRLRLLTGAGVVCLFAASSPDAVACASAPRASGGGVDVSIGSGLEGPPDPRRGKGEMRVVAAMAAYCAGHGIGLGLIFARSRLWSANLINYQPSATSAKGLIFFLLLSSLTLSCE